MRSTVGFHPYQQDRQSGAGNCVCGRAERHRLHPHMFLRQCPPSCGSVPDDLREAYVRHVHVCTCGLPPEADCHMATVVSEL